MIIETAGVSLAIAFLKRKHHFNIEKLRIDYWYLFFLSVIIQFALKLGYFENYYFPIITISYLIILLGIVKNFRRNSMKLMFVGTLLNFLVIVANKGYMPVYTKGLAFAGYDLSASTSIFLDRFHILTNDNTSLIFLADIVPIPEPFPLPQMLSIGDFFMMVGVFIFFQSAFGKQKYTSRH